MEKVIVFFSDIAGTYDNSDSKNIQREEFLMRFKDNLYELKDLFGADRVVFSFVTNDNAKFLMRHIIEFKENIADENIIMGKQFYNDGYINGDRINSNYLKDNLKVRKIIEYIKQLKEKYEVVNTYYADDSTFNIKLFLYFQRKMLIKQQCKLLALSNKELNDNEIMTVVDNNQIQGLNECIEKELGKKKVYMNYK